MELLRNIPLLYPCDVSNGGGAVRDGALVWEDETILWAGPEQALPEQYRAATPHDAGGAIVVPGFIDSHTHLIFGGSRSEEFFLRLQGASYLEILAQGGGIQSTVAATRNTPSNELKALAKKRLAHMLQLGVTTIEAKSGYGLSLDEELRILTLYRELSAEQSIDIVPTILAAHVVPLEFKEKRASYIDLITEELLPEVSRQGLAQFFDIFIEEGAFDLDEAETLLLAAKASGMKLKAHAEQLHHLGGTALAASLGAVSVDHLECINQEDAKQMAEAGCIATLLPFASFYLRLPFCKAALLRDAGVRMAVATDFNPGSAPSYHLPLALQLAVVNCGLTAAEALLGVTANAAAALDLGTTVGTLLPGYQADFVLLESASWEEFLYSFTGRPAKAVFKKGKQLSRNE